MRQEIAITVDAVILFLKESNTKVLLIKRKNDPFKNKWAIPGGFLEENESLKVGAKRELEEETGLKIESLHQLKTYGAIDRDPRGRTISIAFIANIKDQKKVTAADDALEAKWFDIDELPELAFHHYEIVGDAKFWLMSNKI